MKTVVKAVIAAAASLAATNALAVSINISNIGMSNVVGNNEDFTWSVQAVGSPINFNVGVGGSQTFTYGSFSTTDFSLDSADINDNNDSFKVSMKLTPPGTQVGATGNPDADTSWFGLVKYAGVDFDNSWIDITFGNGGLYQVKFLDSDELQNDGTVGLQGEVRLVRDSAPAVPEPTSLMLLGLGLLGVALGRRRAQ